ncbi:hypothetical protein GCM10010172_74090 [Paractinoplanes ferrugineus]|uniref:Uncharacterized protein n=1 Tax=Paractinoplanes ferrugineus TaxID=113564 RepID=A0A919IZT0_9ACTN|nr:hypothetical protein Afe05nite_32750 [Actinoplanes ferrugineus]
MVTDGDNDVLVRPVTEGARRPLLISCTGLAAALELRSTARPARVITRAARRIRTARTDRP